MSYSTKKITELDATTTLSGSDLMVVVKDPTTSPVTKKITMDNAMTNYAHGVSIKKYGATGDGVTDDSTAIQGALTAGAGGVVIFNSGDYLINSTLEVPANTAIIGYGARIFDTTTHRYLMQITDGVSIYGLEFEGAGNTAYDAGGILLRNETGTVSDYDENIKIVDCYLHGAGSGAISLNYVKNVQIDRCTIESCAYFGISFQPGSDVKIDKCVIKDINPGKAGDAYGITFTRQETSDDLTLYPRSSNCTVSNCIIENMDNWHGLDSHAGEYIHFINNIIRDVPTGISLNYTNQGAVYDHCIQNCEVIGNTIEGTGEYPGISVSGAPGVLGTPAEYANNIVIANNNLEDCGEPVVQTSGAILLQRTQGCAVIGNVIKNSTAASGICVSADNKGYSLVGNTIIDTHDASYAYPSGVLIYNQYNVGTISGNTFLRINNSLDTYVMERAIYINVGTNCETALGVNYNNGVTEFSPKVRGSTVWFGHFADGVKLYVNSATPEAAITANIGSLCINTGGGAGTTLFVKESGTGNTGWVGL